MTEEGLDTAMRGVLLDTLRVEWAGFFEDAAPVETSKRYRRQTRSLLADPWAWAQKKARPVWQNILRTAAAVLLVCVIALVALMAASPSARAAVLQWVKEWYETHIVYRYEGEASSDCMPAYGITALPEGYQEVERTELPGYCSVRYQNREKQTIWFDYLLLQSGTASDFSTEGMLVTDVKVNGCPGQLFLSQDPSQSSAVTWIDAKKNIQFTVDGFADQTGLLHMAESISLSNPTK